MTPPAVARLAEEGSGPNITPLRFQLAIEGIDVDPRLDGDEPPSRSISSTFDSALEKSMTSAAPTVCPDSDESRRLAAAAGPVPGGHLDGGQDVFAGGRDDDADRIDLVVRGVGAVEHAGDRSKRTSPAMRRCNSSWSACGGERQRAVRIVPVARRADGGHVGLTGTRSGHLGLDLSKLRWGDEPSRTECKRAVGPAPECSTGSRRRTLVASSSRRRRAEEKSPLISHRSKDVGDGGRRPAAAPCDWTPPSPAAGLM